MRRRCIEMDLEIAVYVMPRLPCARGFYVATLREVTNSIIENQYLRLVLTLVCLSPSPLFAQTSLPSQVHSSPTIYDACSKSFGLYTNDYGYIVKAVYRFAVIAIELAEDSFFAAIAIFMSVVIPRVDLKARWVSWARNIVVISHIIAY